MRRMNLLKTTNALHTQHIKKSKWKCVRKVCCLRCDKGINKTAPQQCSELLHSDIDWCASEKILYQTSIIVQEQIIFRKKKQQSNSNKKFWNWSIMFFYFLFTPFLLRLVEEVFNRQSAFNFCVALFHQRLHRQYKTLCWYTFMLGLCFLSKFPWLWYHPIRLISKL